MGAPKDTLQNKCKDPQDSSTNALLRSDTTVAIPQATSINNKVQARRSMISCIGFGIIGVLFLGALVVAIKVFMSSKHQQMWSPPQFELSEYCCNCRKLTFSSDEERQLKIHIKFSRGTRQCCLSTVEQYIMAMKMMLSRQRISSETDVIANGRLNRLMVKNATITLLHESPIAAHMLIGHGPSNYQDYNRIRDNSKLPPVKNLMPGRSLSLCRGVSMERDRLIIQKKGLYLIYSQMYSKVVQGTNWPSGVKILSHIVDRYNARLPNGGEEKLLQNVHTLVQKSTNSDPAIDFHTSYISGVFELSERDEVYARATSGDMLSRDPTMNYIGLVKIG